MKIPVEHCEDIAQEVKDIHEAMQKISASNLTPKAIILLVSHVSKENQTTVRNVLYGLKQLNQFLKK